MSDLWRSKRVLGLLAGGAIAASVAAVGVAAWQTSGTGDGYGKAVTASALSLTDASGSASAGLYPGATAPAVIRVTNPNQFAVTITQVAVQSSGAISSDAGGACDGSTGVSFLNQTGLDLKLGAGATQTFTLDGAVKMSNSSDTSCQGALFTIPVIVTAASN